MLGGREPESSDPRTRKFLPHTVATNLADKQASDYFTVLGYEPHKEEFCHRRGVCFHQHHCTIGMACAQAVSIRGAPYAARRHAAVPRALQLRVALDDWESNDVHERVRA